MTRTIVCVGDVMTDVVARLHSPLVFGSDSPAPVRQLPGGASANTAAWLAVAGVPVVLVARVGADAPGDAAVAELERIGVRCEVTRDPERPTGTCIVLVSPDGERTMVPDAGANAGLRPQDVPDGLVNVDSHVHMSGYPLLEKGSRAAALHVLALARAAGATVSVDPASAAPIAGVGARRFLGWVAGADMVLANEDEARALTGLAAPADAAAALAEIFSQVVVKLGAEGALWAGRGQDRVVRVPADPVEVVDTTGAGDAFAAGWLPVALAGGEPEAALRAGCALAARVVGRVGARPD